MNLFVLRTIRRSVLRKIKYSSHFLFPGCVSNLSTSIYYSSNIKDKKSFNDVLLDLNLYEGDFEDEALKYKELLSRYYLCDITSSQKIFFVHPYLEKDGVCEPRKEMEDESIELLKTLNWKVPDRISIPVSSLNRRNLFNHYQIMTIKERILANKSTKFAGIFINGDSLFQGHRIELESELFGLTIFDRYSVVLQIFKQHAKTREAKLQVSLAEIPYIRHRLKGDHSIDLNNKHSKSRHGESHFQQHLMELNKRENRIKKELIRLKDQRSLLRRSRARLGAPTIAIVGYTNSGKTTLIKSFTGSDKLDPEDKLFATLDVTLHGGILLHSRQKVLFIDTVGFISDIPVNLVAPFASTLEDALLADLLVHVRDASNQDHERQNKNVISTLRSIFKGRDTTPLDNMIVVFNKVDKLDAESLKDLIVKNPGCLPISATRNFGMKSLATLIEKRVMELSGRKLYTLRVKSGGEEYTWIRKHFPIADEQVDEKDINYICVKTVIKESDLHRFRSHFIS